MADSTPTVQAKALVAALAAMYPDRVVTRDLLDFADRPEEDLVKGIYTVVGRREEGYTNTRGREAYYGTRRIGLLGQIKVVESSPPTPSVAEDAEGVMIDEVKALMRNRTLEVNTLKLVACTQSGQLEYPYGWVAFDLTMQAD